MGSGALFSRSTTRAHWCTGLAVAAALMVGGAGLRWGTRVASAADAYGYVSEAEMLAAGRLQIDQAFVRSLPWPHAAWTFSPLGYRPGVARGTIVPTYPAGLPLLMALAQRLAGRPAVYVVVPLLGALGVWLTFLLGRRLAGPGAGAAAAVLLAASPAFLFQVMWPVSDVPAAAWWTAALVASTRPGRTAAAWAGLAAAAAIVTRPNLVPLAAVIASFLCWEASRTPAAGRGRWRRPLLFVAGAGFGSLVVAALHTAWYGAPWRSGYENFGALYAWANLGPNLAHYPRWLVETETPLVAAALVAPLVAPRSPAADGSAQARALAWFLLAFAAAVCLCYAFYVPYGPDEWNYLRFLLPAFPPVLVLAAWAVAEGVERFVRGTRLRVGIGVTATALLATWGVAESARRGAFAMHDVERRYAIVGAHVAGSLPHDAVLIGLLHTGSVRYYGHRLTLRYDWLERGWLDAAIEELRRRGHAPFIVLEEGEEPPFRERFGAHSDLAALDWPPVAELRDAARVRIYDPADRARVKAGGTVATQVIASRP